eukprot:TRINITY_DN17464_c0_g1_i1.p1 TRINITY_DN17464_c0_g1~~TRINITY_DN17464_c0_g1_i1.p1  ORF type:complete len:222 (+),score=38.03 TRINITY_DN17464_c0_g1_i1:198-863(+)
MSNSMFNSRNARSPSSYSRETPEEILETAISQIRTAFTQRMRGLESEVTELNLIVKERDNKLMDANNVIKRLEAELNDQNTKIRLLQEEKTKAQQETYESTQTVRKLRVEMSKLQAFKKAIIDSFDGDDIIMKTGHLSGRISPLRDSTSLSSTSRPLGSPYRPPEPLLDDSKPTHPSPDKTLYNKSNIPTTSPRHSPQNKRSISPTPLTTSQLNTNLLLTS